MATAPQKVKWPVAKAGLTELKNLAIAMIITAELTLVLKRFATIRIITVMENPMKDFLKHILRTVTEILTALPEPETYVKLLDPLAL